MPWVYAWCVPPRHVCATLPSYAPVRGAATRVLIVFRELPGPFNNHYNLALSGSFYIYATFFTIYAYF